MEKPHGETPNNENGGRGKKAHQPTINNRCDGKTWADVVQSGGINVQIVLGNGNLGQATPTKIRGGRGERRGGAAWRLEKKTGVGVRGAGERGVMGRGKDGPEIILHGGNKGGETAKNGRGREEERGEQPGEVAPERTGLLDKMTRDGLDAEGESIQANMPNTTTALGHFPAGSWGNNWT
jgi:hypothetical protein